LPLLTTLKSSAHGDVQLYRSLYASTEGEADKVLGMLLRTPTAVQLVQAHVAQDSCVEVYADHLELFQKYLKITHLRETALCFIGHFLNTFEDLVLMGIGFYCVLNGSMTIGGYHIFRAHLGDYARGWQELQKLYTTTVSYQNKTRLYFLLMYRDSSITLNEGLVIGADDGTKGHADVSVLNLRNNRTITFEDVHFNYPKMPDAMAFVGPESDVHNDVHVLQGINLCLEPGKITALVGSSGGGKTTIARLLLRFYDPTKGRILLGDTPFTKLNVNSLRRFVRSVDQEPLLFDGTVEENIGLGLSVYTCRGHAKKLEPPLRERIREASRLAQAHDFISSTLEKGYDTNIGANGAKLSGGQRQRIAIARALASRPNVIVLDEATAALDSTTEALLMTSLFGEMKSLNMAVLIIAHRLTTIRYADEINVVKDGIIVERGTHDRLMSHKGSVGHYRALVLASDKNCT
jgi:ABC-type multidrug transport system fused ATPase/permease subunit